MPKIFVHVGLPKTATTTLQKQIFSSIDTVSLTYIGVLQPRNIPQNVLYKELHRAVFSGKEISKTQNLLETELNKGKDLLFSEEMFVLSSKEDGWKHNMENLFKILHKFDYYIIITVREPVNAMTSFFIQKYKKYKRKGKSFYEIAMFDDSLKIYHYEVFFSFLHKVFNRERIFVKKFEELIQNDFDDLLQLLEVKNCDKLLKNYNKKNKADNGVIVRYNLSLINDKTILFLKKMGIMNLFEKLNMKSSMTKVYFFLNKKFQIKKQKIVFYPPEEELKKLRIDLSDQTKYLLDYYKINYLK